MKKLLAAALCCAIALSFLGCTDNGGSLTPSPSAGLPSLPPAEPSAEPSAEPQSSPGSPATGTDSIEDFEEGKIVSESDVPEIASAVKAKYPDAEIKTITHATYMDRQAYKVIVDLGSDKTETVYLDGTGQLIQGTASGTDSGGSNGGGSGGSSGGNSGGSGA